MGLLALGTPMHWDDAKRHSDHVRKHGIEQFLNIWRRLKDRTGDSLLWGDEIEYMVVSFDESDKNATLSLRQTEILEDLNQETESRRQASPGNEQKIPVFHPEFGRYMLESTPGAPYGANLDDLLNVEANMTFRRQLAKSLMKSNEVPMTLTSFPRLGATGAFTDPYYPPGGDVARSLFVPDQIINPHVRFPTLAANIRRRRGERVGINMPVYKDTNTASPFIDPTIPDRHEFPEDEFVKEAALPDHIYMDAMGFGMGCCCLQITFQACSINEARRMYDTLVPVGPIMLALSAAAPIYRGYLADVDCRWDVIAGSVDDRTREERGLKPLEKDRFVIPKSRYDSVDCYIYEDATNRAEYNDTDMPVDKEIKTQMLNAGVDEKLANHFAHLFIRDPIVIFEETLDQDDSATSNHFENIQSTNWQTVRFKPPPPDSPIGWRVEFRSMEVQITDFENAAYSIFIVLLVRAIMNMGLNFYLPISKVNENMHRAHKRDAIHTQKFFFRKDLYSPAPGHACSPESGSNVNNGLHAHLRNKLNGVLEKSDPVSSTCSSHQTSRASSPFIAFGPVEEEYGEFTIAEIINGDDNGFPGLLGVVRNYLSTLKLDAKMEHKIEKSLSLISNRANGSLITAATFIRNFVTSHPSYKHDSVVSQKANYDLLKMLDEVECGARPAQGFLPDCYKGSGTCRGEDPIVIPSFEKTVVNGDSQTH